MFFGGKNSFINISSNKFYIIEILELEREIQLFLSLWLCRLYLKTLPNFHPENERWKEILLLVSIYVGRKIDIFWSSSFQLSEEEITQICWEKKKLRFFFLFMNLGFLDCAHKIGGYKLIEDNQYVIFRLLVSRIQTWSYM